MYFTSAIKKFTFTMWLSPTEFQLIHWLTSNNNKCLWNLLTVLHYFFIKICTNLLENQHIRMKRPAKKKNSMCVYVLCLYEYLILILYINFKLNLILRFLMCSKIYSLNVTWMSNYSSSKRLSLNFNIGRWLIRNLWPIWKWNPAERLRRMKSYKQLRKKNLSDFKFWITISKESKTEKKSITRLFFKKEKTFCLLTCLFMKVVH